METRKRMIQKDGSLLKRIRNFELISVPYNEGEWIMRYLLSDSSFY